MSKKKRLVILVVITIIILGIVTGGAICVYSQTKEFDKVFLDGVYVEDIAIGGLTKEKAKTKIQKKLKYDGKNKNITVSFEDLSIDIPYKEFNSSYNIDDILEEGFQYGHEGNMFKRFFAFNSKDKETYNLKLERTYNTNNISEILEKYADDIYIAPVDAKMERVNGKFIISPDKNGRSLDIKATTNAIDKAYNSDETDQVEAVVDVVEASRKPEFFANAQTPISSFYTSYSNSDPNRNYNLKLGAETINTVVEPGAEFALSNYLEPITAEGGYKTSKVIVNGELVDGVGGGVCQIATTLYNSVLLTKLNITMRQNHSMPVGYIPLGRDATYASGLIDLKFKNPADYPVYIESYCANNRIYVNIFGHESLKPDNEIKFESEVVEVIDPPETKYKDDPEILKGQEVQTLTALSGKRVNLYKCTYSDGELINRNLETESYYRPRAAVIKVGTKLVKPKVVPEKKLDKQKDKEEKPEQDQQEDQQEIRTIKEIQIEKAS